MKMDEISRRTFLVAGGAVVAGAMAGCGAAGGAEPIATTGGDVAPTGDAIDEAIAAAIDANPTLGHLTRHDFDRWHGESFDLMNGEGETIQIELVHVTDNSHHVSPETRERGLREPFAVQFLGPPEENHPDGLHTVTHSDMGAILAHVVYQGPQQDENGDVIAPARTVYEIFFT